LVISRITPRKVAGKPFQGRREFGIVNVPEGAAGLVLGQQADRCDELTEAHLWAFCSNFRQPFKQTGR
jgi:hypothetical protein